MGDDPTNCVVDENCKVYDFKNLFVCDASVFPTSLGVNPQITVMSLATMTAENILRIWDEKFEGIRLGNNYGEACDLRRPITCGLETLSRMFNQNDNTGSDAELLNSNRAAHHGWNIDRNSLKIQNEFHWRGFIPEMEFTDEKADDLKKVAAVLGFVLNNDTIEWLKNYIEGFWKEFHMTQDGKIRGNLNSYAMEAGDIEIIPEHIQHDVWGDVIQLTYTSAPLVYDLVKIIDENTIIGKIFVGTPPNGFELIPFCMTTKYSVEWMDKDDHKKILDGHSTPTTLDDNPGYWALRIVTGGLLTPVAEVFEFIKDGNENSKEDRLLKVIKEKFKALIPPIDLDVAGTERWINNIAIVNNDFMVGKFVSPSFDNSTNVPAQYSETITEGGVLKKRFVIRYSLGSVAGSWIRTES